MAFNDSYITNVGQDLLTAAASGEKITWIRAATSSYDVDNLTPIQMKALTSIVQNDSQYTGSGDVSSFIYMDGDPKTASINCQIDNATHESGGPANLFGVWATTNVTYQEEQLVFVARRGGAAQTSISPKSVDPEYKLFVKFGIRLDSFDNAPEVTLTVADGVYATANALQTEQDARTAFDERVVTAHSASSETAGENQSIYGVKTFENDTMHSGNVLPTASNLNLGENATDGRWNAVYASTFDGTTFTGNAVTATDATRLAYINGSTKTTKLSATVSDYIISYDDIVPITSNSYDLGHTSWQWKHIYASGSNASDGYLIIGNSENNNTQPSIRPSKDGKGWIGFSNYKFAGVCANEFNGTLVEDTAHSIFGIVEDGSTGPFYNGVCSTAASTTTKVVTCSGFTLATGAVITVLFTYASSLSSPLLNVNSTGAKSIEAGSDVVTWSANSFKTFRYNGTQWVAIKTNTVSNYGVCSTASDTAAKAVTISGRSFKLEQGARVIVKFTYGNTASNPTLNVNGTGAKSIIRYSSISPGNSGFDSWVNGNILEFVYDGIYWVWIGYQYYAGASSYVGILGNSSSSNYPLVFTSSVNSSTTDRVSKNLYTDTANSLYYNPSSNTLTCTTFNGNATTATNLSVTPTMTWSDASNSSAGVLTLKIGSTTLTSNPDKVRYAYNLRYASTSVLSATSTSQVTAYGNIVPSGVRTLGTNSSYWTNLYASSLSGSKRAIADVLGGGYTGSYWVGDDIGAIGLFLYKGYDTNGYYAASGTLVSGSSLRRISIERESDYTFPSNEDASDWLGMSKFNIVFLSDNSSAQNQPISASGTWMLLNCATRTSNSSTRVYRPNLVLAVRVL